MKIIIIGAGIGGLTAGIALKHSGHEVEIYERASQSGTVGAGLSLWANAIHAFDQLGIGNQIRQLGVMEGDGGIHDWRGNDLMATDYAGIKALLGDTTVVVHRADLHVLLEETFGGVIHWGQTISHYSENHNKVFAHFEDGRTIQADLLIACDGIHSVIRKQMFPQSRPIYAGYTAYRGVTHFDHSRVGNMWGESWGYGKRFGIAPLSQNRIYWFATYNAPENTIVPQEKRQATLLSKFEGWHHPVTELIGETDPIAILQHDIHELNPLTSWVDGRVALLGDSAHAMTPNLGQGACQAIEDAVVLGRILKGNPDVKSALQQYQSQRISRANGVLKQSRLIGKVGQIENHRVADVRNWVAQHLPNRIAMKNLIDVVSYRV